MDTATRSKSLPPLGLFASPSDEHGKGDSRPPAAAQRDRRTTIPPPPNTVKDKKASIPPPSISRPGDRAGTSALARFGDLSAHSPAMRRVFEILTRFASTDVTLTLVGETGAGKDVLAHAIHGESARSGGPFIVFDCGAVAPNLAESELFGHERGAFTGAHAPHEGAFERADGGTLFLDEIGELPLDLQPRLLRVLESRRVRRVGGTEDRIWDVRIVAATNRDLPAEVSAGRFRQDLYFRLAAAVVPVPSLRDRAEDLPLLVERLLHAVGRGELTVPPATLAALRAHPWPGNVRELKNALSWAIAFVEEDSNTLEPRHLELQAPSSAAEASSSVEHLPLAGQRLDTLERAAIRQTMIHVGGNKVHAARALGISASTLYEKLKKYDL